MNKIALNIVTVLALAGILQGCADNDAPLASQDITTLSPAQPQPDPQGGDNRERLKKCLFSAEQLNNMNHEKYAGKKEQLYAAIRQAKYYASVTSGLSRETVESMTPYYQFKVNDLCNEITWSLYNELKSGSIAVPEKS